MSRKQKKAQIEQLEGELKAAQHGYVAKVRASDFRLLKLALVMVILAIIAAFVHGRIQI